MTGDQDHGACNAAEAEDLTEQGRPTRAADGHLELIMIPAAKDQITQDENPELDTEKHDMVNMTHRNKSEEQQTMTGPDTDQDGGLSQLEVPTKGDAWIANPSQAKFQTKTKAPKAASKSNPSPPTQVRQTSQIQVPCQNLQSKSKANPSAAHIGATTAQRAGQSAVQ